jgi:hypothetical protein
MFGDQAYEDRAESVDGQPGPKSLAALHKHSVVNAVKEHFVDPPGYASARKEQGQTAQVVYIPKMK